MDSKRINYKQGAISAFVVLSLFCIPKSTLAAGAPTYSAFSISDADSGLDWGNYYLLGPDGFTTTGSGQSSAASSAAEGISGGLAFLNLTKSSVAGATGLAIFVDDSEITNLTIGGASYTEGTLLTDFEDTKAVAGTDFCFNYAGSADPTCITLSKSSNDYEISGAAAQTSSSNTAPTSNAGPDQTVAAAASVTLDGTTSSDADSDTLTYAWTQTSGTSVTLSSATAAQPNFTAPTLAVGDADAVLVFSLTVSDGTTSSSADTVTITVEAPSNTAPTSNAGPDQTVAAAASVTLDGTTSSDADSDTLTYAWTQTSGTSVTLSSATAAQPNFTAPTLAVGDADAVLVFSLTVSDGTTSSSADTVTITVEAPSPTPATAFAEYEQEIRATLVDDAQRNLQSTLNANQRMTSDARERFVASQQVSDNDVSRDNVPFDVDGKFTLSETRLSTKGTFFEQRSNADGTARRLFFGDFDLQHDGDTGSSTATLTGRIAWEQMTSEQTMLGYFIGGELAHSNIKGSFEGDQNRLGVTAGGYVVHQLNEQVFLDGFITLGAGRNDLEMANDVLALTSDYTTRTATLGAALSGVYEYDQYEFRPELAFSYGKTWIGDVGFTGVAYGLTDNTLSLDAGNVSITNLTLRPEVVWALDADTVADSRTQLTYAPRLICERVQSTTTTQDCGAGGEIGLTSTSRDGMSNAEFRVIVDKVGDSTRSSLMLNFERQF